MMHRFLVAAGLLAAIAWLAGAGAAASQDIILDKLRADLTVRVINATTNQPARAERVLIREPGAVMTTVAEGFHVDGAITFPQVEIYNYKPYIVSTWVDGVDYHVEHRGQAFLDGEAATVYAFELSADPAGLVVTGLNVLVRRREEAYSLEYVLQVDNQTRPQRTLTAASLPVQLALPAGIEQVDVQVSRGPDPLTARLQPTATGLHGVPVALPPGPARVAVRGVVNGDRLEFNVGLNLAADTWSLLVWPAELEVGSFDLDRDRENRYSEFDRWIGRPLTAGQQVRVTVDLPHAIATATDTIGPAQPRRPTTARVPQQRRFPWLTVVSAVVLLGAYVFWRRSR